jgi:capsid protein
VSFEANRAGWCAAEWIGTGRGWIDPLREAQASGLRLSTGQSSRKDEAAEQGRDWKKTALQTAREKKFYTSLGLDPNPSNLETRTQSIATTRDEGSPDQEIEADVNGDADEEVGGPAQTGSRRTSRVPGIRRRS